MNEGSTTHLQAVHLVRGLRRGAVVLVSLRVRRLELLRMARQQVFTLPGALLLPVKRPKSVSDDSFSSKVSISQETFLTKIFLPRFFGENVLKL